MPNTNIGDIFIKGPDFEFHDLTPEQERLQKIRMLKSEYHASKSHTEKHEAKVKMLGIMTFCESFLFKIEEQQRLEKQKKWWAENSHLIHNIRTYLLPG